MHLKKLSKLWGSLHRRVDFYMEGTVRQVADGSGASGFCQIRKSVTTIS